MDFYHMENEPPEIKRLRGMVMQREAELGIAKNELREAIKAEWLPISLVLLLECAKERRWMKTHVLTEHDWRKGQWEYMAQYNFEAGATKPTIGGYYDNNRFSGEVVVRIERSELERLGIRIDPLVAEVLKA